MNILYADYNDLMVMTEEIFSQEVYKISKIIKFLFMFIYVEFDINKLIKSNIKQL
jgi:lysyl-tRNA synthetase class II